MGLGVDRLAQGSQHELLVPSDVPDEFGFRIMWYVPVSPLDQATYQLKVSGLVEKPQSFSLPQLRRFPQEAQNSRLKCVQCWSARATWGGFRFAHLLEAIKAAEVRQGRSYRLCRQVVRIHVAGGDAIAESLVGAGYGRETSDRSAWRPPASD